jgi:SRSO17 transposase
MSAHSVAPGAQAKRFAAYLDRLAQAAEHADRVTPLKSYCTVLLLPGERKSVEPMAARLYPDGRSRWPHELTVILWGAGT